MGINLVSTDAGYRGGAAAVTLAGLLAGTPRLRTLPRRAPIVRYSIRLALILSLIAAILVAVGPPGLIPYMVFATVGLTAAAVLIPADAYEAVRLLGGAAIVGGGIEIIDRG